MLGVIRARVRSVLLIGLAAALVGGGVALAGSDSGKPGQGGDHREKRLPRPPVGPGPIPDLTWAEFHFQRNGEAQVTRVDRGHVVSAGDDSLTIAENDGNDVTIPVDSDTHLVAGPGKDAAVSELEQGQQVVVSRPAGGAADQILVPPTAAQIRQAFRAGGRWDGKLGPVPRPGPHGLAIPLPPPPGPGD
jgi:hypothetical protein